MDHVLSTRRLANFAVSTAVEIDGVGRIYPRTSFVELITDILVRRCCDIKTARSLVKKSMSTDPCLQNL